MQKVIGPLSHCGKGNFEGRYFCHLEMTFGAGLEKGTYCTEATLDNHILLMDGPHLSPEVAELHDDSAFAGARKGGTRHSNTLHCIQAGR